ncbi:MAG: tRNA uridine-5-carboxymethylaminomethyl(34) synthesis enzyme MnmG [Planctomycetes bacterium]|nr:tRNA uridine-5-carboxymethylaminomethyl(34) synthesis enzyme MnmG [Planctomycetota bacterium]
METDILVIGAGHAGCEAALAAARMGCRVAVATLTADTIAQMSCNPAIGGLAKGQLVREIDALGGGMALAIDATGIQFRMLNSSKGASVRSPRAQADKWAYQHWMKAYLERAQGVSILQDEIVELVVEGGRLAGARTALGREIKAKAAIVCSGTFIGGRTHVGKIIDTGGRIGERAATRIEGCLRALGLPLLRLKTGTCPRLNARSVDFSKMERQPGDEPPQPFSYLTEKLELEQVPCWATWTNERTHALIAAALPDTPLFSGQITGVGPRYCPSFELKVARFPDKKQHHVFIEPEGRDTEELYVNGMSTSVAPELQEAMIHTVPGLEEAEIIRYGYAVEYTAVEPRALRDTLETKDVRGLFLAGQVNGTSGYEEAAAQGLYAGVNAACAVQGRPPFRLGRDEAYIGVLVDDIVTRGTEEPYRLFTSRAEYRIALRQDNADLRLWRKAREYGLIDENRAARAAALEGEIADLQAALKRHGNARATAEQLLKDPRCEWAAVAALAPEEFSRYSPRAVEQARLECRYAGYLARQDAQIAKTKKSVDARIPAGFDYDFPGLRWEAKEKLSKIRPETLGQAMRISGVSPADVAVLALRLARWQSTPAPRAPETPQTPGGASDERTGG